jgi:hypothetical protein
VPVVARWSEFGAENPELAEAGRALFYQYGTGLGFLATVRPDGGPRLHPVCPIIGDGGLYLVLVPSPKTRDLLANPRFALHAMPPENVDDEFVVTGRTVTVDSPDGRAAVQANFGNPVHDGDIVFELMVETALLARYRHRGDWPPAYTRWRLGHGSDAPISETVPNPSSEPAATSG